MKKKETYHILEDEKTTVLTKKQFDQELDKAREEVLEEVLDKSRDLSMLHLAPHIPESVVKEMLSKLRQ